MSTEDWLPHDFGVGAARENVKRLHDGQRAQDADEQLAQSYLEGAVDPWIYHSGRRIVEAALKKLPIEEQERIRADPAAQVKIAADAVGEIPTSLDQIDEAMRAIDITSKAYFASDAQQIRYNRLLDAKDKAKARAEELLKLGK